MTTTKETVAMVLAILKEVYQGRFLTTDFTGDIWLKMLTGIDATAVLAATEQICAEPGQFPPTPGDIRARAIQIASGETSTPTGAEAWERVCQWYKDINSVSFDEYGAEIKEKPKSSVVMTELEKRALKFIGGTWELGNSEKPSYIRHEFITFFDTQIAKQQKERSLTPTTKALLESKKQKQLPRNGGVKKLGE
jgi:hypothetical protein